MTIASDRYEQHEHEEIRRRALLNLFGQVEELGDAREVDGERHEVLVYRWLGTGSTHWSTCYTKVHHIGQDKRILGTTGRQGTPVAIRKGDRGRVRPRPSGTPLELQWPAKAALAW